MIERTMNDIIGKRFEGFEVTVSGEGFAISDGCSGQIAFDCAAPEEIASELREIAAWLEALPVLKHQLPLLPEPAG
jgi:hypothetical protein